MRIPEWLMKFVSRKLAAWLTGILMNHITIGAPQSEIEAAVLAIVDGALTIAYLFVQGKVDRLELEKHLGKDRPTPEEVADRGVKAVTDAAKKERMK